MYGELDLVHQIVSKWARWMHGKTRILRMMDYPARTPWAGASNRMSAEEDRQFPYEQIQERVIQATDASIESLKTIDEVLYWAVFQRHGLSRYYLKMTGINPTAFYVDALEEIESSLEKRGSLICI